MQQLEMDFSRSDREGALKELAFPRGLGVSPITLNAILLAIYRSGPTCFKKQTTLAAECKCSVPTIKRAIAVLSSGEDGGMNLLCVDRSEEDRRPNVMSINWQSLFDLVHQQSKSKGSVSISKGSTTSFKGSACRSKGSTTTFKGSSMIPLNGMNLKNHHQPANEAAAECFDFSVLEELFRSIGLHRFAGLAREFQQREPEVRKAIEVYSAQRSRFTGPGAVVDFLRTGSWPVDGVLNLEAIAVRTERSSQASSKRSRESIRCDIARDWKRFGTWQDATEFEIEAEIDSRLNRLSETRGEAVS
jgi:hypothetical protein